MEMIESKESNFNNKLTIDLKEEFIKNNKRKLIKRKV